MYQLYYYPLNASMAPHFVLQALNVDYELLLVDRKSNAQKSKQYLALNPHGKIPTLIDNNVPSDEHSNGSLVLFESSAICIHLAESNPQSKLIPAIGTPERAKFFQWMMYLSNTVQAELMVYFYPQRHTTVDNAVNDISQIQEQRITEMFALLDEELTDKQFLVSDNVTACDFFLFMLAIWADEFAIPPLSFEHLGQYLKSLAKHPAIKNVCKKENLSLEPYQ